MEPDNSSTLQNPAKFLKSCKISPAPFNHSVRQFLIPFYGERLQKVSRHLTFFRFVRKYKFPHYFGLTTLGTVVHGFHNPIYRDANPAQDHSTQSAENQWGSLQD